MTNQTDPVPALIAARITGMERLGDNGPMLRFDATPSDDGRTITITATRWDFGLVGDRTVEIVAHLSPQIPLDGKSETEGPCPVGAMDQPAVAAL